MFIRTRLCTFTCTPTPLGQVQEEVGVLDGGDRVLDVKDVGELGDVGAGLLADLGHRVDEGDLGGEEGVRGALGELGGGPVGDDRRRPRLDDLPERLPEQGLGPGVGGVEAQDEPVRTEGVLDGERLAEELRVPGDLDEVPGGSLVAQEELGDAGCGADGDGGLDRDDGRGGRPGASLVTASKRWVRS